MGKNFTMSWVFDLKDKWSKGLQKIGQSTNKLSENMKKASAKMTIGITAPITAIGFMALNTAAKFDESMNKVAAVTMATGDEFKKLEKKALEMGRDTQFSASEAGDAMYYLASAGLDTDQVIGALPSTLQLAAAGAMDLGKAADVSVNIMKSMRLGIQDMAHINDVLALSAAKSNTNVEQLAEAMRPIGATAAAAGVSLEDTVAMLSKMADAGEKGSIAGTLLRNAMMSLTDPGRDARGKLAEMNISIDEFVDKKGRIKNFGGLIEQLGIRMGVTGATFKDQNGKMRTIDESMKMLESSGANVGAIFKLFGKQGARAVLELLAPGKNINEFSELLKTTTGTAEKMQLIMMQGLPGAIKMLSSSWEYMQIKMTKGGFGNFFSRIAAALTILLNKIADLDPLILEFISVIAAAAAMIGPLIGAVWAVNAALTFLSMNPIVLIIAGIIALVAAIVFLIKNWNAISEKLKKNTAFKIAILPFIPLMKAISLLVSGIVYLINNWEKLKKSFSNSLLFKALYISFWPFIEGIKAIATVIGYLIDNWDALSKMISESPLGKAFEWLSDVSIPEINGTDTGKLGNKLNAKTQTDINLSLKSDQPGVAVTVEKINRVKGDGNVKMQTGGFIGRTVPVGG